MSISPTSKRRGARRSALLLCLCRSLAAGLGLSVLRLRRLQLADNDLVPLLRLLEAEAQGLGGLALEALDVSENGLSEPLQQDLKEIMSLLSFLRSQPELSWRKRWPSGPSLSESSP